MTFIYLPWKALMSLKQWPSWCARGTATVTPRLRLLGRSSATTLTQRHARVHLQWRPLLLVVRDPGGRYPFTKRKEDSLRLDDFKAADATYLAPFAPAVKALLSKDPKRMGHHQD